MNERLNLELKARDSTPERTVRACEELGAERGGVLRQRDVYFSVPRGRLKLRHENNGIGQLIAYERPDHQGVKTSRYRVIPVLAAAELEAALSAALGVVVEVRKTRRLFPYDGVRIHLDQVEGLGRFVELEALSDPDDNDRPGREKVLAELRQALGLKDDDLVAGSYCELVLV